jgi:hypothetical protein
MNYIFDTNNIVTLVNIYSEGTDAKFFITNEVKDELGENYKELIKDNKLKLLEISYEVILKLKEIMFREGGNINFVNYAKNQGYADPFLIAHAIYQNELINPPHQKRLFSTEIVEFTIVSSDSEVCIISKKNGIRCITSNEFILEIST